MLNLSMKPILASMAGELNASDVTGVGYDWRNAPDSAVWKGQFNTLAKNFKLVNFDVHRDEKSQFTGITESSASELYKSLKKSNKPLLNLAKITGKDGNSVFASVAVLNTFMNIVKSEKGRLKIDGLSPLGFYFKLGRWVSLVEGNSLQIEFKVVVVYDVSGKKDFSAKRAFDSLFDFTTKSLDSSVRGLNTKTNKIIGYSPYSYYYNNDGYISNKTGKYVNLYIHGHYSIKFKDSDESVLEPVKKGLISILNTDVKRFLDVHAKALAVTKKSASLFWDESVRDDNILSNSLKQFIADGCYNDSVADRSEDFNNMFRGKWEHLNFMDPLHINSDDYRKFKSKFDYLWRVIAAGKQDLLEQNLEVGAKPDSLEKGNVRVVIREIYDGVINKKSLAEFKAEVKKLTDDCKKIASKDLGVLAFVKEYTNYPTSGNKTDIEIQKLRDAYNNLRPDIADTSEREIADNLLESLAMNEDIKGLEELVRKVRRGVNNYKSIFTPEEYSKYEEHYLR